MIDNEDVEVLKDKIAEIRNLLLKQIEDLSIKNNDSQPSWFEMEKDDISRLVSDFTEKLLINAKESEIEKQREIKYE